MKCQNLFSGKNILISAENFTQSAVMTKITINHVQRAITLKVSKPQLWSLCSAHSG